MAKIPVQAYRAGTAQRPNAPTTYAGWAATGQQGINGGSPMLRSGGVMPQGMDAAAWGNLNKPVGQLPTQTRPTYTEGVGYIPPGATMPQGMSPGDWNKLNMTVGGGAPVKPSNNPTLPGIGTYMGQAAAAFGPAVMGAMSGGQRPQVAPQPQQGVIQRPSTPMPQQQQRPNPSQDFGELFPERKYGPVYSPNFNTDIMPTAQAGINAAQMEQYGAIADTMRAGNAARVGGGLQSVSGGTRTGDLQNPGLYQNWYTNSPKAQTTVGAFGDVGDARWRQQFGNDPANWPTIGDQGQVIGGNSSTWNAGAGGGGGSGGGGGAGGSSNDRVNSVADWYQKAYDEARAANLERYEEAKGIRTSARDRALAEVDRLGGQERKDIDQRYKNLGSDTDQHLIARGLGNSTRRGVMQRGVEKERSGDVGRLDERLRREKIGLDQQLTDEVADLIERRDDTYPDINQLIGLMKDFGASGYGQPGYTPPAGLNFPQLQQPPGLPPAQMPNMPFWMPPGAGQDGAAAGGHDFEGNGNGGGGPNVGQPAGGGGGGGYGPSPALNLGGLAAAYGASQYMPQIVGGAADFMRGNYGDWGNQLGGSIVDAVTGASGYMPGFSLGGTQYQPMYSGGYGGALQQAGQWGQNIYDDLRNGQGGGSMPTIGRISAGAQALLNSFLGRR
jgi:hypothetical protein